MAKGTGCWVAVFINKCVVHVGSCTVRHAAGYQKVSPAVALLSRSDLALDLALAWPKLLFSVWMGLLYVEADTSSAHWGHGQVQSVLQLMLLRHGSVQIWEQSAVNARKMMMIVILYLKQASLFAAVRQFWYCPFQRKAFISFAWKGFNLLPLCVQLHSFQQSRSNLTPRLPTLSMRTLQLNVKLEEIHSPRKYCFHLEN